MSEHPSPPDPLHEVLVGRLWQSGSRLPEEEAERFDAIVMVGEESQPWLTEWMQRGWTRVRPGAPRLPLLVHAPLIDADGWLDAATATATARYVRALLESGRRVLIHCDGGAFRSPFLAALVLAEVEGIPGLEALRRVDALRGRERRGLGYPDYDALLGRWPEKPSPGPSGHASGGCAFCPPLSFQLRSFSPALRRLPMSSGSSPLPAAAERLIAALVSRVRNLYAALGLFLVAGLLIALLALWGLSLLAEAVQEGDTLLWDRWLLAQIQRYHRPLLDQAALNVTALGSNLVTTFFGLVGALFFWLSRHRYSAVLLLASIIGSGLLARTLKSLFDRPRPQVFPWLDEYVGSSSFPSGHSMNSFVVYVTLALLTARLLPTHAMRLASFATALLLVVSVGATRLYLGVHYLTDVAAGYLTGMLWIATCVSALEVVRRFRRRQPEIARQEEDLEP